MGEKVVVGTSTASRHGAAPVPGSLVTRRSLFGLLSAGGRGVTLVSASPGSGKTVLLRSWIDEAGLHGRTAWVSVERGEQDAQGFWLSVIGQLRAAAGADALVERLEPTPEFDGQAVVERLLADLGSLDEPVVLVVDDLHELRSPEALAQLEVLLARRPSLLQVVLATRRDPHLGLHRLRLAGELTEIRDSDLDFTLEETRELLAESGIALSDSALALLHARTEGWAAGLRLAALSLTGHPDPERFVAEFSGSEHTVADYLLSEVLERQPEEVRRLLLRTSILERVNGALADLLTGASGSERILHALEETNAFVVSVDAARTWFRCHHMFADLLRLELRRTDADAVKGLHRQAAEWFAQHGHVLDAVRHAEAGENWGFAAHLLADHSFRLWLNGRGATAGALLAAFPADARSDPELNLLFAGEPLMRDELDAAAAYLAFAERNAAAVPDERRHRFEVSLAAGRLALARRHGDLSSLLGELQSLSAVLEEVQNPDEVALGNDARAVALMNLGIAELWTLQTKEARRHLQQGLELARRIEAPHIEVGCLTHLGLAAAFRSFGEERERCLEAVAAAEAHGWTSGQFVGLAFAALASLEVWQARFEEAQSWLERAEEALGRDREPATGLLLHLTRGMLQAAQGRYQDAVETFRAGERLQARLDAPHALTGMVRGFLVQMQVRLGDTAAARATLAAMTDEERNWGESRAALASLHLADGDPGSAVGVLAPILDGSARVIWISSIQAFLLDAIARDLLAEPEAAGDDIERALELAEPSAIIFPFVMSSRRDMLERHPRHMTAHAALLSDILDVIAGSSLPLRERELPELGEGLSESELRVLRYLPTNLSAPDIGRELYLSVHTVKAHMRHVYAKLGVHSRAEALERARELGLLAPSARRS